jgi:hypothetical protein
VPILHLLQCLPVQLGHFCRKAGAARAHVHFNLNATFVQYN